MNLSKKFNSKYGLALVELLIGMFILLLIGMAVFLFQRDIFSLHKLISGNLTIQYEARSTIKTMTAEIRSVSPSNLGAYPLTQVATSTFIFYSDIDGDSLKEHVRYFLDGTTLKKGVIKPSGSPLSYDSENEVISEVVRDVANATSSVFYYFGSSYEGTSPSFEIPFDISLVRLIKIYLVIDDDLEEAPRPLILTTQVSMRNLKDNL